MTGKSAVDKFYNDTFNPDQEVENLPWETPKRTLYFKFCWLCGSNVGEELTPDGVIVVCPTCSRPTTPDFEIDETTGQPVLPQELFTNLTRWWEVQISLLESLHFRVDDKTIAEFKQRHPDWRESPKYVLISSLDKLIKETLQTYCMKCAKTLEMSRRGLKKTLCDEHYMEARRAANRENMQRVRQSGVIFGRRPKTRRVGRRTVRKTWTRNSVNRLPPAVRAYYLNLPLADRQAFAKYFLENKSFQDFLT